MSIICGTYSLNFVNVVSHNSIVDIRIGWFGFTNAYDCIGIHVTILYNNFQKTFFRVYFS